MVMRVRVAERVDERTRRELERIMTERPKPGRGGLLPGERMPPPQVPKDGGGPTVASVAGMVGEVLALLRLVWAEQQNLRRYMQAMTAQQGRKRRAATEGQLRLPI